MVVKKLEITKKLGELALKDTLNQSLAILNLPAIRYCERNCHNCVTSGISADPDARMSQEQIKTLIDYFTENFGTKIITINGRGDPFHPLIKDETLFKVVYGASKNLVSYVFTAGDNLDEHTCRTLASQGTNVMISLFGNRFIDEDFFAGKEYSGMRDLIAKNLRRLISVYQESDNQIPEGVTRLGMNYVITNKDLENNGERALRLRDAVNEHGLFFVCNVDFNDDNPELESLAKEISNFNLDHSTFVNGTCQMGAGSSATVDYDGAMLRCPYLDNSVNDGNFFQMSEQGLRKVLNDYMRDRTYSCVLRKRELV